MRKNLLHTFLLLSTSIITLSISEGRSSAVCEAVLEIQDREVSSYQNVSANNIDPISETFFEDIDNLTRDTFFSSEEESTELEPLVQRPQLSAELLDEIQHFQFEAIEFEVSENVGWFWNTANTLYGGVSWCTSCLTAPFRKIHEARQEAERGIDLYSLGKDGYLRARGYLGSCEEIEDEGLQLHNLSLNISHEDRLDFINYLIVENPMVSVLYRSAITQILNDLDAMYMNTCSNLGEKAGAKLLQVVIEHFGLDYGVFSAKKEIQSLHQNGNVTFSVLPLQVKIMRGVLKTLHYGVEANGFLENKLKDTIGLPIRALRDQVVGVLEKTRDEYNAKDKEDTSLAGDLMFNNAPRLAVIAFRTLDRKMQNTLKVSLESLLNDLEIFFPEESSLQNLALTQATRYVTFENCSAGMGSSLIKTAYNADQYVSNSIKSGVKLTIQNFESEIESTYDTVASTLLPLANILKVTGGAIGQEAMPYLLDRTIGRTPFTQYLSPYFIPEENCENSELLDDLFEITSDVTDELSKRGYIDINIPDFLKGTLEDATGSLGEVGARNITTTMAQVLLKCSNGSDPTDQEVEYFLTQPVTMGDRVKNVLSWRPW